MSCNQGKGALRDQCGSCLWTGKNVTDYAGKGTCGSEVLTWNKLKRESWIIYISFSEINCAQL